MGLPHGSSKQGKGHLYHKIGAMALPSACRWDIYDFERLDACTAARHLGNLLAQKGFCFIKGCLTEASVDS